MGRRVFRKGCDWKGSNPKKRQNWWFPVLVYSEGLWGWDVKPGLWKDLKEPCLGETETDGAGV
jgi:hypothetical protein